MNKDDVDNYVRYRIALSSLENLMSRSSDIGLGISEKSAITTAMTILKDKKDEFEVKIFSGDKDE